MAAFNKYNDFVEQLGLAKHDLSADAIHIALSNTTPVATHATLSVVAEIAAGNGYTQGGKDTENTWSENPAATGEMVCTDKVWTASGGAIAEFQYVILFNETQTSPADALIGWWDHGSKITLADTETFTVEFGANTLTIS